jgi:hypothetical protein
MNGNPHRFSRTNQPDPSRRARGPVNRSAVTSGKKLLDGVDCRLPPGRRFADLCRAYERQAREAGGDLSVVGRTMIRQAASLTVMCEKLQADQLNGKEISIDDLVRASSEIRRILAVVTGKPTRNQAAAPSALEAYLAESEVAR